MGGEWGRNPVRNMPAVSLPLPPLLRGKGQRARYCSEPRGRAGRSVHPSRSLRRKEEDTQGLSRTVAAPRCGACTSALSEGQIPGGSPKMFMFRPGTQMWAQGKAVPPQLPERRERLPGHEAAPYPPWRQAWASPRDPFPPRRRWFDSQVLPPRLPMHCLPSGVLGLPRLRPWLRL